MIEDGLARELLERPNIAHIATTMADGAPHCVPTWIDADDGRVLFLTGPASQKARNLAGDPRISISVADAGNPAQMVHLRGRVIERIDGERGWELIDRISHKYVGGPYPRDFERVVFVVDAEHVTANDFSAG